jgi:O-antigen ligase
LCVGSERDRAITTVTGSVGEPAATRVARRLPRLALSRGAGVAACTAAAIVGLAASHGGYYAQTWGWATLVALATLAVGLAGGQAPSLGRLDMAALAALGLSIVLGLLSTLRPDQAGRAALEVERDVLYLTVLAAGLVAVRRRSLNGAIGGVLAGIVAVSLVGLSSLLLRPTRVPNRFEGRLLYDPVGYANAMGILVAVGIAVAIGCCAHASSRLARTVAAAALVPLTAAFVLTESRGAQGALLVAAGITLAVDPYRGRVATTALTVMPLPALAAVLAVRSPATDSTGTIAQVSAEGQALAIALATLTIAAGAVQYAVARKRDAARGNRIAMAVAAMLIVATIAGAIASAGSLGERAAYWRATWADARAHPALGSGAGSFAVVWLERRDIASPARDAHNLYLETLAELGPVGLAAVLVLFGVPLIAGIRARGQPLIPAVTGAYVAVVLHAALDWDWEMPAVVVPTFILGAVLLAAARRPAPVARIGRMAAVGWGSVGLLVACVAVVGLIGNHSLAAGTTAASSGNWQTAARLAETASRWAPWSAEPHLLLGDARLAQGDRAAARDAYAAAARRDAQDWRAWVGLARVGDAATHRRALARLGVLDPLSGWATPVAGAGG